MTFLYTLFPNLERLSAELGKCFLATIQMVTVAGLFSFLFGLFLGILLIITRPEGIKPNKFLNTFLNKAIDIIRAIPFIILVFILIPVSRAILGTSIGVTGSYVALIAGTVPFFARQIESALSEVDNGLIEASISMGFQPIEIILHVYLKESIPSITRVTMITLVNLVGLTAIAGAIGAGGLGDFAIRYGYQMSLRDMIWVTVALILLIITVIQCIGTYVIHKTTH